MTHPQVRPDPAFGLLTLYDDALPHVYGYLLARCGDTGLAEDLTAESFLAAVHAVRKPGAPDPSIPWLIGVARHKLADYWRRAEREQRGLRLLGHEPGRVDDPWEAVVDRIRAREVLDRLGAHHRAALTLRYLDGLPVPEVARYLDRTVHATETAAGDRRRRECVFVPPLAGEELGMSGSGRRPVVAVANRLPIRHGDEGWELSPGGLVTALRPVMETHRGAWVGWDGGTKGAPETLPASETRLRPISLSAAQVRQYYHGFANATLWPLLHDAIEKPRFERSWWRSYQDASVSFTDAAVAALADYQDALAWVHDYHLTLVPSLIRARLPDQPIGFFLHIPWPAPEIFARVPWRQEILLGMLGADVISFHAERYRDNFARSCAQLLGDASVYVSGSAIVLPGDRQVLTTTAPISIDTAEFSRLAVDPDTTADISELREQFAGRTLLLGVDRLDYSKGIVERLLAVEALLDRRPDLRTRVAFLQVAVPSRDNVAEYRGLRATIEGHVGRINGRFTEPGSDVPLHYLHRTLSPSQLVAYYAVADMMLVTPLIDGMNLVAKEYVIAQRALGGSGSMILSEFAGAGSELREAIPCNPFDVEGLSLRIEHALELEPDVRRSAITAMAAHVKSHDVHRWVAGQLADIEAASHPVGRIGVTAHHGGG